VDRTGFFRGPWAGALALILASALSWGALAAPQTTGAVGQIVPAGGIVAITGAPGSVVTKIFVRPGQQVKAGTLLMTTMAQTPDSDPALARKQLQVAEEVSAQQVEAQTDTVALAQSRYDQAKTALDAYQGLSTIVSRKEMDGYVNAAGDAAKSLAAEQARLKAVKAQADGNLSAARRQLEAAMAGTELRAPVDGTVLKIARQLGQKLGSDPAVQMGDLSTMYVVSQVDEGDLLRLKPGMAATITAQPLSKPLHGRIEDIDRLIDTQARLGEVRIRLDSTEPASRMVGMQVDVAIAY
jgi:multidrug resistance efflux pump